MEFWSFVLAADGCWLIGIGVALGIGGALLRRSRWGNVPLSFKTASGITALAASIMLGFALRGEFSAQRQVASVAVRPDLTITLGPVAGADGTEPDEPLPNGTSAPSWAAVGWINGPPPTFVGPNPAKLIVIDLWAHW